MKAEVKEIPIPERVDEFPLPVAGEEYQELLVRAERTAKVIDRHLDYESKAQQRELSPMSLCPVQKRSLVSDVFSL